MKWTRATDTAETVYRAEAPGGGEWKIHRSPKSSRSESWHTYLNDVEVFRKGSLRASKEAVAEAHVTTSPEFDPAVGDMVRLSTRGGTWTVVERTGRILKIETDGLSGIQVANVAEVTELLGSDQTTPARPFLMLGDKITLPDVAEEFEIVGWHGSDPIVLSGLGDRAIVPLHLVTLSTPAPDAPEEGLDGGEILDPADDRPGPQVGDVLGVEGLSGDWRVVEVHDYDEEDGWTYTLTDGRDTIVRNFDEIYTPTAAAPEPELVEYDPSDSEGTLTTTKGLRPTRPAAETMEEHQNKVVSRIADRAAKRDAAIQRAKEEDLLKAAALGDPEALDPAIQHLRDQIAHAAGAELHTPEEIAQRQRTRRPLVGDWTRLSKGEAAEALGWARLSEAVYGPSTIEPEAAVDAIAPGDRIVTRDLNLWDVTGVQIGSPVTYGEDGYEIHTTHHEHGYRRTFTARVLVNLLREGAARILPAVEPEPRPTITTEREALALVTDALHLHAREGDYGVSTEQVSHGRPALTVRTRGGAFTITASILR